MNDARLKVVEAGFAVDCVPEAFRDLLGGMAWEVARKP